MRYILSDITSPVMTFLRSVYSFLSCWGTDRAGVVEHEHGLRRPLFHPPQKRSLDLTAFHDVEGTVDLHSYAALPGEACYPINVACSIAIGALTSSAGHAGKTKPATLAIDSAATTAALHRRQSNGGSVRT